MIKHGVPGVLHCAEEVAMYQVRGYVCLLVEIGLAPLAIFSHLISTTESHSHLNY